VSVDAGRAVTIAAASLIVSAVSLAISLLGFLKGGKSGELWVFEKSLALRQWRRRRAAHTGPDMLRDHQATRREAQDLFERRQREP
jgi:hypothetical protein